jgi:hypothetical protein
MYHCINAKCTIYFELFPKETALNSTERFFFVMEALCAFHEVGNEFLNTTYECGGQVV